MLDREELKQALADLLSVSISVDTDWYYNTVDVRVKIYVDGEEISSDYDSFLIPGGD